MGSNRILLLTLAFVISDMFFGHIMAQPTLAINSNTNGYVSYGTQGVTNNTLRFYLFGDGYYSFQNNATHQFPANSFGYNTKTYFVTPYDPSPPLLAQINTGATGSGNVSNPPVVISNSTQVSTSWSLSNNIEHFYILAFKNTTSNTISGCLDFYYNNSQLNLNSGGILQYNGWVNNMTFHDVNVSGFNKHIKWNYTNLPPNQVRLVYIPMKAIVPTNTLVNTGSRLRSDCNSNPPITVSSERVMAFPFDPNNKFVNNNCIGLEEGQYPAQSLEYTITFKNIGEGVVNDVRIEDPLDSDLDLSTVQILDAEYHYTYEIINGVLNIYFDNINLPGTKQEIPGIYSSQETESWVKFKVCTKDLEQLAGKGVSNRAIIFFDQLEPIYTNEVWAAMLEDGCDIIRCDNGVVFRSDEKNSPSDILISSDILQMNKVIPEMTTVTVMNTMGQVFYQKKYKDRADELVIDFSNYVNGLYYIVTRNENKNEVIRVVKQ